MGIVTEAGFYNGKFLKAGQFDKAEVEATATGVDVAPGENGAVDLDAMTKDELLAEAKKRNVEVKATDTKAEIIKVLEAK